MVESYHDPLSTPHPHPNLGKCAINFKEWFMNTNCVLSLWTLIVWNYSQMNTTEHILWHINSDSVNGMLLPGNRSLPESVLTQILDWNLLWIQSLISILPLSLLCCINHLLLLSWVFWWFCIGSFIQIPLRCLNGIVTTLRFHYWQWSCPEYMTKSMIYDSNFTCHNKIICIFHGI